MRSLRSISTALLAAVLLAATPTPAVAESTFVLPPIYLGLEGLTNTTASIRWLPPQPGGVPAAWTDVYQMPPYPALLLASVATPAVRTTLTGLTPGTEYTIHLRSRAADGRISTPTGSVTFTTLGSPNDVYPCWVKYRPLGGNGSAYTSITVTNRSSAPLNGWVLTWTFPDANQRIVSFVNGVFTQTGPSVRVVNMPWNGVVPGLFGTLPLNAQVTFVNVNPIPTEFRLNGNACASL